MLTDQGMVGLQTLDNNSEYDFGSPPMGAVTTTGLIYTGYFSCTSGGRLQLGGGTYTGVNTVDIIITTIPSTFEVYQPENH